MEEKGSVGGGQHGAEVLQEGGLAGRRLGEAGWYFPAVGCTVASHWCPLGRERPLVGHITLKVSRTFLCGGPAYALDLPDGSQADGGPFMAVGSFCPQQAAEPWQHLLEQSKAVTLPHPYRRWPLCPPAAGLARDIQRQEA